MGDLEALEGCEAAANMAMRFCGRVDVLFNNAGRGFRDYASKVPIEVDQKIMNINFLSGAALVKTLLPTSIDRDSGHVVPISSVQGFFGLPGRTAYAASKHASHGFYDSLRSELA